MKNNILNNLNQEWDKIFQTAGITEKIQKVLNQITDFSNVYPNEADILRIFKISDPRKIRVVIIGQDPYHGYNQANGIAFSVNQNVTAPPSLKNIFKELYNDLQIKRENSDLSDWVEQGVLLINSAWTVEKNQPASHKNLGWEEIVVEILDEIDKINPQLIYCLWGNHAKKIYNNKSMKSNFVIESMHPSPFSYKKGFEGTKPFSKINHLLSQQKFSTIKW